MLRAIACGERSTILVFIILFFFGQRIFFCESPICFAETKPVIVVKRVPSNSINEVTLVNFYEIVAKKLTETNRFAKVLHSQEIEQVEVGSPQSKNKEIDQAFEQFDRSIAQAKGYYDSARLDEAVKEYENAIATIGPHLVYMRDNKNFINACLSLTLAYQSQKMDDRAIQMVKTITLMDPDLELDKTDYPPKFLKFFEQYRKEKLAEGTGKIQIVSSQENVRIYLDGTFRGEIPSPNPMILTDVPLGEHVLLAEKPGAKTDTSTFPVEKETREIRVELPTTDLGIHFIPLKKNEKIDPLRLDVFHKFVDDQKVLADILLLSFLTKDRNNNYTFRAQLFDARIDLSSPTLKVDLGYHLKDADDKVKELALFLVQFLNQLGEVTTTRQYVPDETVEPAAEPEEPEPATEPQPTQEQVLPKQPAQEQPDVSKQPETQPEQTEPLVSMDDDVLQKKKIAAWTLLGVVTVVIGVIAFFLFTSSSGDDGKITVVPPGQ